MSGPVLLTVVLNYRTAEMTLKAVEAALIAMKEIDGSLTIVDNDSGDGSFERLTAETEARGWTDGGRVQVLQSGHNGGFGAGNNVGIRAGLPDGRVPDYVYILNSDAFPAPDAITALMDRLESHPETGFAGSYIHGPEGDWHCTCFRFPSIWGELEEAAKTGPVTRLLRRYAVWMDLPEETRPVDWLAGASVLMRRSTLDEIGLFDETFFLYFEETDLCLRLARAGWRTDYVLESRVAHIGSVSTGMKSWKRVPSYWFDSRLYYYRKNHGVLYAGTATALHVAGSLLYRMRRLVQRRLPPPPRHFLGDLLAHDLSAFWRGLTRRPQATPQSPVRSVGE